MFSLVNKTRTSRLQALKYDKDNSSKNKYRRTALFYLFLGLPKALLH